MPAIAVFAVIATPARLAPESGSLKLALLSVNNWLMVRDGAAKTSSVPDASVKLPERPGAVLDATTEMAKALAVGSRF